MAPPTGRAQQKPVARRALVCRVGMEQRRANLGGNQSLPISLIMALTCDTRNASLNIWSLASWAVDGGETEP